MVVIVIRHPLSAGGVTDPAHVIDPGQDRIPYPDVVSITNVSAFAVLYPLIDCDGALLNAIVVRPVVGVNARVMVAVVSLVVVVYAPGVSVPGVATTFDEIIVANPVVEDLVNARFE